MSFLIKLRVGIFNLGVYLIYRKKVYIGIYIIKLIINMKSMGTEGFS